MNVFELYRDNGPNGTALVTDASTGQRCVRGSGVWVCGKCGILYGTTYEDPQRAAEKCCAPVICSGCGLEVDEKYWTVCRACRDRKEREKEAATFEKAEKLTDYEGPVYWSDRYYSDLGEFVDTFNDDLALPEYVWACNLIPFTPLDVTADCLENYIENMSLEEGIEPDFEGFEEFKAAFEKFNEANKGRTMYWLVDETRAVKVSAPEPEAV